MSLFLLQMRRLALLARLVTQEELAWRRRVRPMPPVSEQLLPQEGESAEEYKVRGLAIVEEKQVKNAAFLKELILDEQAAENDRLRHLQHLDQEAASKKSKSHRVAKISALRLYEKQRVASRNKVEALIHDCNVSFNKLKEKFAKELEALEKKQSE
jgi:hypothetical protein